MTPQKETQVPGPASAQGQNQPQKPTQTTPTQDAADTRNRRDIQRPQQVETRSPKSENL